MFFDWCVKNDSGEEHTDKAEKWEGILDHRWFSSSESFKSQKKPIEESDTTIQKQEPMKQIKSRGRGKPY